MLEWLFVADISTLGWIHSIVGLVAISVGIYSLLRHQAIDISIPSGHIYWYTTMFTAVSSLFIYNATGGFNLAHLLSVFTVLALLFAIVCRIYYAGVWIYLEHLALTGTVFFSLIPTTAEVLTRTGVVTGLESPVLGLIYSYYVLIFAVLVLYQMYRIRRNPYNLSEFNRI